MITSNHIILLQLKYCYLFAPKLQKRPSILLHSKHSNSRMIIQESYLQTILIKSRECFYNYRYIDNIKIFHNIAL